MSELKKGVLISELTATETITDTTVLEVEHEGVSVKLPMSVLVNHIMKNTIARDQLMTLLNGKLGVDGQVADSQRLEGKTLTEIKTELRGMDANNSATLGGQPASYFATGDDVARLDNEMARLAGILQGLFDSLNGNGA